MQTQANALQRTPVAEPKTLELTPPEVIHLVSDEAARQAPSGPVALWRIF